MNGRNSLSGPLADPARRRRVRRRRRGWGSSPTPASASAARPARWPARSGTACPEDGLDLLGMSLRQHRRAGRELVAARRVHRAAPAAGRQDPAWPGCRRPDRALGEVVTRCCARRARRRRAGHQSAAHRARGRVRVSPGRRPRHARFSQPATARRRGPHGFRWLMASDVCKHCTHAGLPGRLPDRRAVPHRVRHGRGAGGHLQRLRLLRLRPARTGSSTAARRRRGPRSARCATTGCTTGMDAGLRAGLPDRVDPVRDARRAARAGRARVAPAARAGSREARLYGARPGRRRRRRRRVLPAARRARGVRAAAGPGRAHPRREVMWRRAAAAAGCSPWPGSGRSSPRRSGGGDDRPTRATAPSGAGR